MAKKKSPTRKSSRKKQGRFIVLDGPDGAGKSTQAQWLKRELEEHGQSVLLLREPGGTPAGEAIRKLLLEQKEIGLSALTETFLFQAARAELMLSVIEPALKKGQWVVCDRYTLSTLVYQGLAGGVEPSVVETLSQLATSGRKPDRYLILWVSPKTGVTRRAHRANDRMESKGDAFVKKVSQAFKSEAEKRPKEFSLIDGSGSIEEVQDLIWKQIVPLLEK
jgi:dTMP kinase